MSDSNNPDNNMHDIKMMLGQLSGEQRVMHKSVLDSINVVREDLRRSEDATKQGMLHLETRLNAKIDDIGTRVKDLEAEDKKQIEKTAKLSAWGGGIGGALAAGIVELIQRMN